MTMKLKMNELFFALLLWASAIAIGFAVFIVGPEMGYYPEKEKSQLFSIPIISLLTYILLDKRYLDIQKLSAA